MQLPPISSATNQAQVRTTPVGAAPNAEVALPKDGFSSGCACGGPPCTCAGPQKVTGPSLAGATPDAPPTAQLKDAGLTTAEKAAANGAPGTLYACTPELRAKIDALQLKPGDVNTVLYHKDCFDGFGARVAAEELLGDKATYIPVAYDQPIPQLPADAKVAIVDFSYPRDQLEDLNKHVAGLVVLDHHKAAVDALNGLPYAVFDMDRAGAGLSWNYFHPDKAEPDLLKYMEDRDLWKFKMPQSHEVSDAVASYDKDFKTWEGFNIEDLQKQGAAIERYKQELIHHCCDRATTGKVCGYDVPVANTHSDLRSEVGAELLKRNPDAKFAAIWYIEDGHKMWSVRSRGDFDVNEIAKHFGGGGHAAAAGFRDPGELAAVDLEPKS